MWGRIDLALRFIYVALMPFLFGALSSLIPVGGIIGGATLATAVALFGTRRWRDEVEDLPVIGRLLAGFSRLGEYYAERTPKPLLYYIVYPVIFPYWLVAKQARREFLLYRGINVLTMLVIAVVGFVDYFRTWKPLPFSAFFGTAIGSFFIQLVLTFAIVMPIVTTIVILHARRAKRWLVVLLVLGGLTGVAGVAARKNMKALPFDVAQRIKARSKHAPEPAAAALLAAIQAAAAAMPDQELALYRARGALDNFYREDEASAFKLWTGDGVVLLYARLADGNYVWLAHDAGHVIDDPVNLPSAARDVMAH